jgi:site-specific recombinase XerD
MKKEFMQAAPELVRQFLIYDEAIKNKSSATIDEYFRDLQTFLHQVIMKVESDSIKTQEIVKRYKEVYAED